MRQKFNQEAKSLSIISNYGYRLKGINFPMSLERRESSSNDLAEPTRLLVDLMSPIE